MILGASHIVLTSTDLTADKDLLEAAGWRTQFIHRDLPTHPRKNRFLSTDSKAQSLIFLRRAGHLSIELIHYADTLADQSPAPICLEPLVGNQECLDVHCSTASLRLPVKAGQEGILSHRVSDVARAKHFWEGALSFRICQDNEQHNQPCLNLPSVIPEWRAAVRLTPAETQTTSPSWLDGPGIRCISFIVKDIDEEVKRLEDFGLEQRTGRIDAQINKKQLKLQIVAGLDGLLFELLEVA